MSKRYGRAQKRKAKERIAQLTEAHTNVNILLKKAVLSELTLRKTLQDVLNTVESVCQHSIALPPKCRSGAPIDGHYRVAVMDSEPNYNLTYTNEADLSFKTVDVFELRTFLQAHREELYVAIHLELSDGAQSAYMISETGLRDIPEERLINQVIPSIASDLIRYLRRQ